MMKQLPYRLLRVAIVTVACLLLSALAFGQGMKDIRINEVLINNTDSYMDDYGHRNAWIELRNTGFSQVNLAGGFLKVVRGADTISYKIPKNDPRTMIAPQGYAVFFADGKGSKGTFYTNFTLDGSGKLQLYDASGRGLAMSEVPFNEDMSVENVSYGWFTPTFDLPERWMALPQTTPFSTNDTIEFKPKHQIFAELDPSGIVMAVTAMAVVFMALLLLYQVFKQVGNYMIRKSASNEQKAQSQAEAKSGVPSKVAISLDQEMPSEVIAAIGVAICQYERDLMDMEAIVLTINRVGRAYSPWNSKLYGITNQLKK